MPGSIGTEVHSCESYSFPECLQVIVKYMGHPINIKQWSQRNCHKNIILYFWKGDTHAFLVCIFHIMIHHERARSILMVIGTTYHDLHHHFRQALSVVLITIGTYQVKGSCNLCRFRLCIMICEFFLLWYIMIYHNTLRYAAINLREVVFVTFVYGPVDCASEVSFSHK